MLLFPNKQITILLALFSLITPLFSIDTSENIIKNQNFLSNKPSENKYRFESNISYDYLDPNKTYGNRKTLLLNLFYLPKPAFNPFVQLGFFSWKEGEAFLGVIGAYKDWLESFYTYTAFSSGSNSTFIQKFRFDNDFNYKLGDKKNIVCTAGISYIDYYDVHEDTILSSGVTLYFTKFIYGYRLLRNQSNPGKIFSSSHILSLAYGKENWQWTYLTIYLGGSGYLATYINPAEIVDEDFFQIDIKNKLWLKKDYGLFEELSFLKLKNSYDKYYFSFGIFKSF